MNEADFFTFSDYKALLKRYLSDDTGRKLTMASLARETGYQRSFLSRVLNAELHLTTEGAYKIATAMNLTGEQTQFLFWLVEKARAGDPKYRTYANNKATEIRREYERRQKAPSTPVVEGGEHFVRYFSTWTGVAIHLATATSKYRTVTKIADRFGLSSLQVESILSFLVSQGLVEKRGGEYHYAKGSIHLAENSPWVHFHHSNWRSKALMNAQLLSPQSVHFTNVLTLTTEDAEKIRETVLKSIERVMKIASPSSPEDLVCLNIDYFRI